MPNRTFLDKSLFQKIIFAIFSCAFPTFSKVNELYAQTATLSIRKRGNF